MNAGADRTRLTPMQRRALLATPAGWLSCGLGSGLVRFAQGTAGSLAAMLPWLLLRDLTAWMYGLALLLVFMAGVRACTLAGRALGVDDHRALVIDEWVGLWFALLPALHAPWWMVALGFALFRLFDIAKPWPIGWLDRRLKGGLGVMLDDVIAGAMAAIALALVLHFVA
jgi:phosphatidylglycerophosphatase A